MAIWDKRRILRRWGFRDQVIELSVHFAKQFDQFSAAISERQCFGLEREYVRIAMGDYVIDSSLK